MATKAESHVVELALDEHIEAFKDRFGTNLGCTENLLKCLNGLFFVAQLAVHLESQEVNFELIFLPLVDHRAALLYGLACPLVIAQF